MTQLELKLANSNSDSCRTTVDRAQYSSSFLTAPVEKVFFRSVLMMKPHRACTHDRQSFVSPPLSILVLSN